MTMELKEELEDGVASTGFAIQFGGANGAVLHSVGEKKQDIVERVDMVLREALNIHRAVRQRDK
jgi:hypothetical protein